MPHVAFRLMSPCTVPINVSVWQTGNLFTLNHTLNNDYESASWS